MRSNIVEGEPGIFPAPIARLYNVIRGWFGDRRGRVEAEHALEPPDQEGDEHEH